MIILNIIEEGSALAIDFIPNWMTGLDHQDVTFIRNFILASGSLKEVAAQYGVTYPTVRLRLDKVIQKINVGENTGQEPYIMLIKQLAIQDKLDFDTAKILINEYKRIAESKD